MVTCYFPHRRHALARHIFSLLNSTSVVCLLVKGARSCATEHRGNEICSFRFRPLALHMLSLVFAANFTSLSFVSSVYNMGNFEKKSIHLIGVMHK